MEFLLSLVSFVVILALIILVHELGHFLAAKLMGVKVHEFAIGFGPKIWSRKQGETLYRINLFPIGGFVSLEGEGVISEPDSPRSFSNKAWGAKVFILTAGVIMNFLLAVVMFGIYLVGNNYQVNIAAFTKYDFIGTQSASTYLYITSVVPGSVAEGNVAPDSLIISVDGNNLASSDDFVTYLDQSKGQQISITTVSSQDLTTQTNIEVTLPEEVASGSPLLGVEFYEALYALEYPKDIGAAFNHGLNLFGYQMKVLSQQLQRAINENRPELVTDQVGSVVAVGAIVGDIVSSGQLEQLINITALISLSLAFVNILPIPALDGGHVVIVTLESLIQRKLPEKLLERINQVSFIVLIVISFLFIFKDIVQFDVVNNIISGLGSVFGS